MATYWNNGSATTNIEYPLYGSSRLGQYKATILQSVLQNPPTPIAGAVVQYNRILNQKTYELNDHLGNVLVTLNDFKFGQPSVGNSAMASSYLAKLGGFSDYYPFGMQMPGRIYQSVDYRFGYNGKERDNEIAGNGNVLNFGDRIYDSRIERWFGIDKLVRKYPGLSPYLGMADNPIILVDSKGDDTYLIIYGSGYTNYTQKGKEGDQTIGFMKNAEAQRNNIMKSGTFDKAKDAVVVIYCPNTKAVIQAMNEHYISGQIKELHYYGHGDHEAFCVGGREPGWKDPKTGHVTTVEEANEDLGRKPTDDPSMTDYSNREFTESNFPQVDFTNFTTDAKFILQGCGQGGEVPVSAAVYPAVG